MNAHEESKRISDRLIEHLARIMPLGEEISPIACEKVRPPSVDFQAALSVWQDDPTPATRQQVRTTARRVIEAWALAAAMYRRSAEA